MSAPPHSAADLDRLFQAAIAAHGANDFARAATIYDSLLSVLPTHPVLLLRRGVLARQVGDKTAAIRFLRAATTQAPQDAEACSNLGNALADVGDPEARATHLRAASLAPDHPGVLLNSAGYLVSAEDAATAAPLLERLVRLAPRSPVAWGLMGDGLRQLGQPEAAEAAMRQALEFGPGDADRWYNLGNLLYQEGAFAKAQTAYRGALALRPEDPATLTNLGLSLLWSEDALALHERALAIDPNFLTAEMNRAVHLLRVGDRNAGWKAYEVRHRMDGALRRDFTQPRWAGEPLGAGERLLLWSEQGSGDVLFHLRFLPAVMERVGAAVVELHPGLGRLSTGFPDNVIPVERGAELPAFTHQLSTSSLPAVLGDADATFPYLDPPADALARWTQRLSQRTGAKVGLVWAGNPNQANDRLRSRTLVDFGCLFEHPGVTFYSLQVGGLASQAQNPPGPAPLVDLSSELSDFGETAALLSCLDLLISVDTSTLNLAGALGLPAWAVLAPNPDWRWGLVGEATPFYPSIRLFRRLTPDRGDAEPKQAVIVRLDEAFTQWLRSREPQ